MKSLFIFIALICYHSLFSQESWTRLSPNPTQAAGLDIHFLNDQTGFIITLEGLLKTTDGGVSWNLVSTDVQGRRIAFRNDLGFVVGNSGRFFKTEDAGENWTRLPNFTGRNILSLNILDDNSVAVVDESTAYTSSNRGETWQTFPVEGLRITDAFFTSPMTGHVVSKEGTIMKTSDGGENWKVTESTNQSPSLFNRVVFINSEVGFASREHSDIFKTTDSGESWVRLSSSGDAVFDFYFMDENNGYVVGEHGVIYRTSDGGISWEKAGFSSFIFANDLYSVLFLDELRGFVVGLRGRILKTTDGGNSWESYWPMYYTLSDIDFVGESTMYVRMGNNIFKSTDDGKAWADLGSPLEGEKTVGIEFLSPNLGYAIGGGTTGTSASSTKLFKTTDGGNSWSTSFLPVDARYLKFLDENNGFVNGRFRTYRTTDGGANWELMIQKSFRQIQFVSENTAYASSYLREVYKTTDAGNTWSLIQTTPQDLYDFHFYDEQNGFFVGGQGMVLKTEDGGETLEEINLPYEWYENVKMYSEQVVYTLDEEGKLYKTVDGGDNWEFLISDFTNKRLEIFEKEIFVYGEFGGIIKASIPNIRPFIAGANTLSTPEETTMDILLTDLTVNDADNNFPDDFTLQVYGGTDYSFDGNSITPDIDFNGTLNIALSVNDGLSTSERYTLVVEVTPVNDKPVITGASGTLSTQQDMPIGIDLNDFIVEDPDNDFPADFSLELLPGDNYTLNGLEVFPASAFNGTLSVQAIVNDGIENSDIFPLEVVVGRVTSLEEDQFFQSLSVFPNPTKGQLTISFSSSSYANVKIDMINSQGVNVIGERKSKDDLIFSYTISDLELPEGIYLFNITQENNIKTVKVIIRP